MVLAISALDVDREIDILNVFMNANSANAERKHLAL